MAEKNNSRKKIEVLVVEDSKTQAEKLKVILEENNFNVSVSYNGREALRKLSDYKPAIVISDIVMPEMDGYELCRRIKQSETLKAIPVILLTSLSGIQDVINGLEAGADNFIIKPYDEEYLLSRIQHIIENFDARKGKKTGESVEILFKGRKFFISSKPYQIIDFLLSTYETAVQKNLELVKAQEELIELSTKVVNTNDALENEIVERKNMEKELKRSNTELEQFARVVSHDLQQPLIAANSYLRGILENHRDKTVAEVEGQIKRALDGFALMQKLIKNLLMYARIGREKKDFADAECGRIIDAAVSNLKVTVEEAGAAVRHENLPNVRGDELLLIQLFQNLIGNAVKFRGSKPPEVDIKAKQKEGGWLFSVKDNGIGFEQKYADEIFEMFQRLHKEEERPGLGLGLAICKKIVELHGGSIWAKSSAGKGAVFYFTLPGKPEVKL